MKFINLKKLNIIIAVALLAIANSSCDYEVMVILAGISGLAAAKELIV